MTVNAMAVMPAIAAVWGSCNLLIRVLLPEWL
jgi:hypothetical protein